MEADKCEVTVSLGVTKNLGNFESVRYDVSIRLSGDADKREQIYEDANNWVGEKINKFQGKKS